MEKVNANVKGGASEKKYDNTLILPKTEFPMRGNLAKNAPNFINKWESEKTYSKMVDRNKGKTEFILHDGPPYANGSIHIGTAMNKLLKDFIVKYKNMAGFYSPFVPGWDTHGLPIELKALKELNKKAEDLEPIDVRQQCKKFAKTHIQNQMAQFKALGTLADYDRPYITMNKDFEAREVEVFGEMFKAGHIYQGLKPVYWCPDCKTALAEAEIEYQEDPCTSMYVKFKVTDTHGHDELADTSFVIWTTTPWTIPGNLAICLGPEYMYSVIQLGNKGDKLIVASELVDDFVAKIHSSGAVDYKVLNEYTGAELEYMKVKHPLYDRESLVIVGSHVTLESGTGCVHTAPGYGVDDFEVCKHYPEVGIIVCVDDNGRQTAEAGKFEGMTTDEANKAVIEELNSVGALVATEEINHKYPHCWRCGKPIIFRATVQWFCSVKGFVEDSLNAIKTVEWFPAWGEERMGKMLVDRSDWCISRQKSWGVPIPVFYCKHCNNTYITDDTIKAVADVFRAEGSDSWWKYDADYFLKNTDSECMCGCNEFYKEHDILDVWFDSGVTYTAVMDQHPAYVDVKKKGFADLYLEGADQYRGWFQSSLLTSVVFNKGKSPYRQVSTHGWLVDGEGRAMHKHLGNGVDPDEVCKKFGADIMRLWIGSTDYHSDVRCSEDILKKHSEAYRKIRNTLRFMIANTEDLDVNNMVDNENLEKIDIWALDRLYNMIDKCKDAYEKYEFNTVSREVLQFLTVDMSSFYMDIIKDRLYCDAKDSNTRRAAQSTLYRILSAVVRIIAPILSFTAEEIWGYMKHEATDNTESVFMNDMPVRDIPTVDEKFIKDWNKIIELRDLGNAEIEKLRNENKIGKSLECDVTIGFSANDYEEFKGIEDEVRKVLIVSRVFFIRDNTLTDGNTMIAVDKATGEQCERCWAFKDKKYYGKYSEYPTLCNRCAEVLMNKQ